MKDEDALEQVKLITGKPREIQGKLYTDDPEATHERLDALLLSLLEKKYPKTIEYVKKLRLWYA
jgi:hypothetical protein